MVRIMAFKAPAYLSIFVFPSRLLWTVLANVRLLLLLKIITANIPANRMPGN
jgi:hypothetical protein